MADQLVDFFRSRREHSAEPTIDWQAKKSAWVRSVEDLYGIIEEMLRPALAAKDVVIRKFETEVTEDFIGTYFIPVLELRAGAERVEFMPKGLTVVGAEGRVDIRGERDSVTLLQDLASVGGWAVVLQRVPRLLTATRRGIAEGRTGARHVTADVTRRFEPHSEPDIDSVWLWFEFQLALVGEARGRILRTFAGGRSAVVEPPRVYEARLIGMTRVEVEAFFDAQRGQLELLTMFELLASTEAILRIEFRNRIAARKKDGLTRRFREIHKSSSEKVRLDEDILGAMIAEGAPPNVIAAFRGTLKLRHWLAHGRHWHPKLGRGYAPNDVLDIAKALIASIPS